MTPDLVNAHRFITSLHHDGFFIGAIMQTTIALNSTTDYSLFRHHQLNRNIGTGRTLKVDKKILNSMKEHGFRTGLHIKCYRDEEGALVIFDGHRRFEHAKLLGICVVYAEYRAEDAVDPLEYSSGQKTWSLRDKCIAYSHKSEDYQEVMDFHSKTGIPHTMCLSMFFGQSASSGNANAFAAIGEFRIKDRNHPNAVAMVCEVLKAHCDFATEKGLVSAISKAMFAEGFDANHLIKQINRRPELLKKCRTQDEYVDLLELIYNYGNKSNRLFLKVEIEKAMRARSAAVYSGE